MKRFTGRMLGLLSAMVFGHAAMANKIYDQGASDTEIVSGNIVPYSGPASAYSVYRKIFEVFSSASMTRVALMAAASS